VIHAGSSSESEAYRLFLVLNDRGKDLSEADFLKTRTMELLRAFPSQQKRAAAAWSEILSAEPVKVKAFLRAYYALYFGKRAPSKDLHRAYRDEWFSAMPRNDQEAARIADFIGELQSSFALYRKLSAGIWPYAPSSLDWWQDRLRRLVSTLRQDSSIPLLMAASKGPETRFAQVVFFLERYAFTYALCGGHASSLGDVYFAEAKQFAATPARGIKELRDALADVSSKYVSETKFRTGVNDIRYGRTSAALLKHFLTTIDDVRSSPGRKADANPVPADESAVFMVAKADIEHIYPQTPEATEYSVPLEAVKHSLGNLAFLYLGDNRRYRNKPFAIKQVRAYKGSKSALTRDLADKKKWPRWTAAQVRKRQNRLVARAVEIFGPF
jgi:hypothetical protein